MVNCLMLDIDGVLNNFSTDRFGPYTLQDIQEMYSVLENTKLAPNQTWSDHTFELEIDNLQTLRILIKKYSIKHILICSSWRHVFPLVAIRLLFITKGYPDIAKLIDLSTGVVTEAELKASNFKRMRTAEIAFAIPDFTTTLSIAGEKISNWYVLDDDVGQDDLDKIKGYNVSSLYFEFKSLLKEYKAKEQLLINNLAFDRPYDVLPYEEWSKDDDPMLMEVKEKLRNIKNLILDPDISLSNLVADLYKEIERCHIAAKVLSTKMKPEVPEKEEKNGKTKRRSSKRSN